MMNVSVLRISVLDLIHHCEDELIEKALALNSVKLSHFTCQFSKVFEEFDILADF